MLRLKLKRVILNRPSCTRVAYGDSRLYSGRVPQSLYYFRHTPSDPAHREVTALIYQRELDTTQSKSLSNSQECMKRGQAKQTLFSCLSEETVPFQNKLQSETSLLTVQHTKTWTKYLSSRKTANVSYIKCYSKQSWHACF